jgi:hypothetical protein
MVRREAGGGGCTEGAVGRIETPTCINITGWDLAQYGWDLSEWLESLAVNDKVLDPSILRHRGIWGVADEPVLNYLLKNPHKIPCVNSSIASIFHTKHISEPLSPLLHWCILFIKPLWRTVSSMMYCVCNIVQVLCYERRKIRIMEANAKCRHLKELTCKGTSEAQKPIPPPLHTVYVDTDAGVLVRKLSQLTSSDKLSGLTPGISSCSVE